MAFALFPRVVRYTIALCMKMGFLFQGIGIGIEIEIAFHASLAQACLRFGRHMG
jgi:hypothetical protein